MTLKNKQGISCAQGVEKLLTDEAEQVEISIKYEGYITRQQVEINKQANNENTKLPKDIDYSQIRGLSIEVQQKLTQQQPETMGQASRISGVTPASLSLVLVHLKRRTLLAA
jgi:tRNA uridine 5-carboxymethylaminomethyl modification enzyme